MPLQKVASSTLREVAAQRSLALAEVPKAISFRQAVSAYSDHTSLIGIAHPKPSFLQI